MWTKHLKPGEEQRPIKGWPGYYVSTMGRVFSYKRQGFQCSFVEIHRAPRVLKPTLTVVGERKLRRLIVSLKRGRAKQWAVPIHVLVARVFIGPKPARKGVLHWDDDYRNNRLSNLRYGTQQDNADDARRNRKVG